MPNWINVNDDTPKEVKKYFAKINGRKDILSQSELEAYRGYCDDILWLDDSDSEKNKRKLIGAISNMHEFGKHNYYDLNQTLNELYKKKYPEDARVKKPVEVSAETALIREYAHTINELQKKILDIENQNESPYTRKIDQLKNQIDNLRGDNLLLVERNRKLNIDNGVLKILLEEKNENPIQVPETPSDFDRIGSEEKEKTLMLMQYKSKQRQKRKNKNLEK